MEMYASSEKEFVKKVASKRTPSLNMHAWQAPGRSFSIPGLYTTTSPTETLAEVMLCLQLFPYHHAARVNFPQNALFFRARRLGYRQVFRNHDLKIAVGLHFLDRHTRMQAGQHQSL